MMFNVKMASFIGFGAPNGDNVSFSGKTITQSTSVKDLGVILSNDLKWNPHNNAKIAKCSSFFFIP